MLFIAVSDVCPHVCVCVCVCVSMCVCTYVSTHPVESDDEFVTVVLVLVGAGLDGEVCVGSGDARQQEVDHGPQLPQRVLQRVVNQQDPLLAAVDTPTKGRD